MPERPALDCAESEHYLLPEHRRLLNHVPVVGERTAEEVWKAAPWWTRSKAQVGHGLRVLRARGYVESPKRGRFRLTQKGAEAMIEAWNA